MHAVLAAFCFAASCLPAQQLLTSLSRLDFRDRFTPMGDLNGDGYEDVLVSSQIYVGPSWASYDYELRFYSGRDGSLIRRGPRWAYPDVAFSYPTGDHDGDGTRDYICRDSNQATATTALSVRSGRDDHILWRVQHPVSLYWAYDMIGNLDVDGDGRLDVVAGHPVGASSQGEIWAYDYQGNLLYHRVGTGMVNSLAQSLARLGDVNNDGCDDYIAGLGDPYWYGAVAVVSGIDGQILRVVYGQNFGDYIGSGCVGCGDLDGDGTPDFAAGGGLSGSYGSVQAFSGRTGQRLFATYSGRMGDWFGAQLRTADYDHDGVQDIFVAARPGGYVVSGRNGAILPSTMTQWGTFEVQPLFTPGSFPNLLVSTTNLVYLLHGQPPHSREFGRGCTIGATSAFASPEIGMRELLGHDRRITLHGAQPGTGAFLLLGLADQTGGRWNLGALGLPACTVYPNLTAIGFFVTGASGPDNGYAHHDFQVPGPAAFGRGIDAQWLTLDTNGSPMALSAAMRFAIWR